MLNPKFRFLYIIGGIIFLSLLIHEIIISFPDFNPIEVLKFTIPDILFFGLAYKTYPVNLIEDVI